MVCTYTHIHTHIKIIILLLSPSVFPHLNRNWGRKIQIHISWADTNSFRSILWMSIWHLPTIVNPTPAYLKHFFSFICLLFFVINVFN